MARIQLRAGVTALGKKSRLAAVFPGVYCSLVHHFPVIKIHLSGKLLFGRKCTAIIFRMVKVPADSDLIRLKQFLKALEADDVEIPRGEVDEIQMLKREIACLEETVYPSKAFLFREIVIDYGASLGARR
jgi:hypothetical protein